MIPLTLMCDCGLAYDIKKAIPQSGPPKNKITTRFYLYVFIALFFDYFQCFKAFAGFHIYDINARSQISGVYSDFVPGS